MMNSITKGETMHPDPKTAPSWALAYDATRFPRAAVTADVVGFALNPMGEGLQMVVIRRGLPPFQGFDAWPGGYVDVHSDVDARWTALRELREETGLGEPTYMETLDTYDALGRDPRQFAGVFVEGGAWASRGARVFSKAQLALFRREDYAEALSPEEGEDPESAHWVDVYDYLPWEDVRSKKGLALVRRVIADLEAWAAQGLAEEQRSRVARLRYAFGSGSADWNEERVPERWVLMMEAGLVAEAHRDAWGESVLGPKESRRLYGRAMAFDHRAMLADALARLRGKMKYVPATLHALLPLEFTLGDLQSACEQIGGRRLYKSNFRKVVARSADYRIVEPLGRKAEEPRRGPRAELYAFPEDVLHLRLDPSIRMPWIPLAEEGEV